MQPPLVPRRHTVSAMATESRQHRLAMSDEQLSIGLAKPLPRSSPRPTVPIQPDLDATSRQGGQDLLAVPLQPVLAA
jgi:hypothetical protein